MPSILFRLEQFFFFLFFCRRRWTDWYFDLNCRFKCSRIQSIIDFCWPFNLNVQTLNRKLKNFFWIAFKSIYFMFTLSLNSKFNSRKKNSQKTRQKIDSVFVDTSTFFDTLSFSLYQTCLTMYMECVPLTGNRFINQMVPNSWEPFVNEEIKSKSLKLFILSPTQKHFHRQDIEILIQCVQHLLFNVLVSKWRVCVNHFFFFTPFIWYIDMTLRQLKTETMICASFPHFFNSIPFRASSILIRINQSAIHRADDRNAHKMLMMMSTGFEHHFPCPLIITMNCAESTKNFTFWWVIHLMASQKTCYVSMYQTYQASFNVRKVHATENVFKVVPFEGES